MKRSVVLRLSLRLGASQTLLDGPADVVEHLVGRRREQDEDESQDEHQTPRHHENRGDDEGDDHPDWALRHPLENIPRGDAQADFVARLAGVRGEGLELLDLVVDEVDPVNPQNDAEGADEEDVYGMHNTTVLFRF